jgi:hypothetical protein
MTATINQCLAALKTLFDTADFANAVHDYRVFPDKLAAEISLSYQGGNPTGGNTTAGDSGHYDVTAVCRVQCTLDGDGKVTDTALRNAEQTLNTIENAVYTLMGKGGNGNRGAYWLKTSFPSASTRPPSPTETPTSRMAFVPFRLHLK